MTQRTLACSVSASVYDQFRALLPEGADVNRQLCALVDAFIAGHPTTVDLEALKAKWLKEWIPPRPVPLVADLPDTAPMAVYDPDRPLQEQIDALGPDAVIQFRDPVDVLAEAQNAIGNSVAAGIARQVENGSMAAPAFIHDNSVRYLADPDLCLHPHETLVRDGRFVRCTLCDRIIR